MRLPMEIQAAILDLHNLELWYKKVKQHYSDKKTEYSDLIEKYLNKSNTDKLSVKFKSNQYDVKKITPTSIEWDADALEGALSKENRKKVINKTYTITDMQELAKYLKSRGVNPEIFKGFVEVEKEVDQVALNQLYELGEVRAEDLQHCYRTNKKSSYLKISVKNGE